MWTMYDRLISRVGLEDKIAYCCQGDHWTMIKTAQGRLGVAATNPARSGKAIIAEDYLGMKLCDAAQLIKSWDFEKASLGLAAINAVVNDTGVQPNTENPDAFLRYRNLCEGRKVAVVGHFAYLESRLEGLCDLYVLERKPSGTDYPDPACEYLLPDMDVVFITGCAVSNKTMPRLLQLCHKPFTVISGPSTPMDKSLFDMGADALCGFCVTDEAACRAAAERCEGIFKSGRMVCLEKRDYMRDDK